MQLRENNNLTVDLTSNNKVFNCLSPQGSWIFHRFGKREYPLIDIDISKIKNLIESNKITTVNFYSIFGDTLAHPDFEDIFNFCKEKTIPIQITTNGFYNNILNAEHSSYRVKLYGFTKTINDILFDEDIDTLKENLLQMKNLTIEYHCYKHNLIDLPELLQFCKENNINILCVPGVCIHDDINHVIDVAGNWIHDINGIQKMDLDYLYSEITEFDKAIEYFKEFNAIELNKSVIGYHVIKLAVGKLEGEGILDTNLLDFKKGEIVDEGLHITVTGHILNNFKQFVNVSSAIPNDWKFENFSLKDDFQSDLVADLSNFTNNRVYL